jgi:two-component system sensor histidine kinase RpfC
MHKNTEFIQALIRLSIGLLTYAYVAAGIQSKYFPITPEQLNVLSLIFFSFGFGVLASLYWKPASVIRRYISLAFDICSTTVLAYFTGGINSVYVLVYLWIYIGYGSRYGKHFLYTAVVMTLVGYNILILTENAWSVLTLDAIAFLLLIIALPFYLHSMQKRLQHALEEAEQSNRAKTEFLSTMTHQIRTPIGGVVGMIDLLNKTRLDAQQKQYLQALTQSSNALQEIIEDVVDFSQIEQGNIHLEDKTFQPRTLINSLMHSLAPLAHEKNIELNYYIAPSFPWRIYNDAQRLRQLLSNLIRYAIDQCHENEVYVHASAGPVSVSSQSNAAIEIHYTPALANKRIFTHDIANGEDNLPLRIAEQLTRLMGGGFDIRHQGPESVITLNFSWKVDELITPSVVANFTGRNVLIYEPNTTNRRILEDYCTQMQLTCSTTDSADNLIAHILWSKTKNTAVDIIILCDSLAHNRSHELVHRIRQEAQCKSPILHVTYLHGISRSEPHVLSEVNMTLNKPLALEQLAISIERLLTGNKESMSPSESRQRRILLAEDSEINASVLYTYLTDMGHNVDIATDGNTALYAMHQHHYDIVFMDLHMPNMDGIETTQRWRKLETRIPPLPIVAITARTTSDDKKKCMQVGMSGFLTKPVSAQQLEEAMKTFL